MTGLVVFFMQNFAPELFDERSAGSPEFLQVDL